MKRKNKIITGMAAAVLALAAGSICAYADGGSGDIDGDGSITATDVVCAAAYVKGIRPLYGQALAAADVNGDGSVNAADVAMLAAHVKGIRSLNGNYSTPDPEPEPQGPVIEVRNGVTYVDGILIANKPSESPPNASLLKKLPHLPIHCPKASAGTIVSRSNANETFLTREKMNIAKTPNITPP